MKTQQDQLASSDSPRTRNTLNNTGNQAGIKQEGSI